MTPYSSLVYFAILMVLLLPMMVASLRGRVTHHWLLVGSLVMLAVQYAWPAQGSTQEALLESVFFVGWLVWQWLLLRLVLRSASPRGTAWWSVPLSVGPLVIVKMAGQWHPDWHLGFDGISYVSFRALDVVWMISDGALKAVGTLDYLVFLCFFPTLSSGPIDRFRRFQAEWRRTRTRAEFWADVDVGIGQLFHGLLYKFVIAACIDHYFLSHAARVAGLPGVLQYGLVWGLYLFFDFAGYSAFAIGVSRCFGIRVPGNFAAPWGARNVREFWNRWHISLSTWFRDHVYMRFLLMARKRKWFARPETASALAYYVSFGIMGLWHGLTLHYLAYGLYHATALVLCDAFGRWRKAHPTRLTGRAWVGLAHLLTILCVSLGFWIFSGHGWVKEGPESKGFFGHHLFSAPPTPEAPVLEE